MREDQWDQEAVDQLKVEILGVFRSRPTEAEGLYRNWKEAHLA